jgi:hypothetical protein
MKESGYGFVRRPIDTRHDPNVVEMNPVELSITPFVLVSAIRAVLL